MRPKGTTKYDYSEIQETVLENGKVVWTRPCPICKKEIKHKSLIAVRNCHRQRRKCNKCGSWNKGLTIKTSESLRKMGQEHSKRMLKFRKNNPPWNKGLTKETNDIIKTTSEKFKGFKHTPETKKLIGEFSKKLWDEGYWGGRSSNEWFTYKNKVHSLTRKTIKEIQNYNPKKRGRCGKKGAFQIDHIVSIQHGFLNNISPEKIAEPSNLQFIPWEDNNKKRGNCVS